MNKLLLFLYFILFLTPIAKSQIMVITHKSTTIDKISDTKLLDFYTGDIRKWNDGKTVIVFDLKPKTELKKSFYKILGKSTSRMKSIWMKKMLSGEGDPPEALKSEEEMLKKISTTPGAVGFISESKLNGTVKVLKILKKK